MRKLSLALACIIVITGLAAAADVTLVKFDSETKEVTVKEGESQKTYKITDKTKFTALDKDGAPKEMPYTDAVKGLSHAKAEGRLKFDITVKGAEITVARMPSRKNK